MESSQLARVRWRLRGAWLAPVSALLTVVDALVLHLLPIAGQRADLFPSLLVATFFNLTAVALLGPGAGWLLRRVRPDLPVVVARDYAGLVLVSLVAAGVLALGIAHHGTVTAQRAATRDSIARARDFIARRAPREFRVNLAAGNTVTILAGRLYRTCVPGATPARAWCVVVDREHGAPRVRFAGHEPNSSFSPLRDMGDH